ncbi:unnamed protein product [Rotaria magnacalcarata]|uniref:WH1 domain-containing protein n=1 Tax=Rotaria magnacalcarata TaxID=392030 RepID=A0A816QSN4_9BILA|nr:unnamed protein product [Rotaria magnacalcarata]
MNGGDGTTRQQRPTNNPSRNLSESELRSLYDILGSNCVTLATAVAQVLHGYNGTWRKQACGVFCFVKDYGNRSYCFRLYDLKAGRSIYDELVPASLRLDKSVDVFYTFDGSNCKIGINFVDRDEAQTFCHHFHSKQEDRRSKKEKKKCNAPIKAPPPVSPPPPTVSTASAIVNGMKSTSSVVSQPVQTTAVHTQKKSTTTKQGFFTIGRSKKNVARPDISAPIQSTLVHVSHIGTKESFFNDDEQKQLFEKVLSGLHISQDDQIYLRDFVKTDGGLQKLLEKPAAPVAESSHQGHNQHTMSGGPPEIPPRSYPTISRNNNNGNRVPHQDISAPMPTYNQSSNSRPVLSQGMFTPPTAPNQQAAPTIPPRPGPRMPDNAYNSTQAPSTPPPPPPPLSHPSTNTGRSVSAPVAKPPNGSAHDDLLSAIRSSGTSILKPTAERPPLKESPSSDDASPGAQDTMAMNILKILAERREKLRGPENEDDSDSTDGEWSN